MRELIDRYVYAVSLKLPESQRADIEQELRGLIEDMLEERGLNEEATANDVEQVLIELGPPYAMAARYREKQRYLIGPGLIDHYWSVLKIVIYSLVVVMGIVSILEYFTSTAANIPQSLLDYVVTVISVSIQSFAWVTVIFAYIEYRGSYKVTTGSTWTPHDLPSLPPSTGRIKPIEPVLGIMFAVVVFVIFTFSLEQVGVHRFMENISFVTPVFDIDAFAKYLPLIWILTAISIMINAMKLVVRRWTTQIFVMHIIFNLASVVAMVIVFSDSAVWNPAFMEGLVESGIVPPSGEAYDVVFDIWNKFKDGLLFVIIAITAIDTISHVMKIFKNGNVKAIVSKK
ncbi:permease prefix domain 1-containing protein [Paenibacillus sp. JCM 10914]|uniref:hypothetical protein n=1 Tax=Paenibacillus sp. JCM 10914 TaxID=1236974 RepID=UPI0003CC76E6|nr:hypothetical protein [Paenibacillus sp. JCM 10914]GAE05060.1 membrane protein, putative [Paenibacillus sp. JCM 10914]